MQKTISCILIGFMFVLLNSPSVMAKKSAFLLDKKGNMIKGLTPEGYSFTAAYDDIDRNLTSVAYTDSLEVTHNYSFEYDANGFLAKQVIDGVETRFVRGLNGEVLQERDGLNNVIRSYVWNPMAPGGIGGLLEITQNGQHYYPLYDGKGNVIAITDSADNVVASYKYDPFGNLISSSGTFEQPFMFSTKPYYPKIGLSYFGYRFYSPALGRWLSRDPMGEESDPNLYRGMGNNPVNNRDPYGLYIGQYPPSPPGYDPDTWQIGRWDNGLWTLRAPDNRIYTIHPEDSEHWRHWGIQDPDGNDKGDWPPNPGKRKPQQKGKLQPHQCDHDPSGDAPGWEPPSGVKPGMPFIPVDPIPIRLPSVPRVPMRIPYPVRIPL